MDVRTALKKGIAQQLRGMVGLVNGAVTPFWGGRTLGKTLVGYVNWAQSTAYFPLRLVEILSRIGFPLFAWRRRWRPLLLGGAAVGWLVSALLYGLPLFGPAGFIFCLSFVTPPEWRRFHGRSDGGAGGRCARALYRQPERRNLESCRRWSLETVAQLAAARRRLGHLHHR